MSYTYNQYNQNNGSYLHPIFAERFARAQAKNAQNATIFSGILSMASGIIDILPVNQDYNCNCEQQEIEEDSQPVTAQNDDRPEGLRNNKIRKELTNLLEKNGFNSNDPDFKNLLDDVIRKRNIILRTSKSQKTEIDPTVLSKRLINYAKGRKFIKFQENAALSKESITFESDCAKAKSEKELQEAYKQFGAEYVEYFDQDNSGDLNAHEIFFNELVESYLRNDKITLIEAKKKATSTIDKFKEFNATNLPQKSDNVYGTLEHKLFIETLSKMDLLDTDNNSTLNKEELASYLATLAFFEDAKNNITSMESNKGELGITFANSSLEEILDFKINNKTITKEAAQNIQEYAEHFKKQHKFSSEFIKTGKFPKTN